MYKSSRFYKHEPQRIKLRILKLIKQIQEVSGKVSVIQQKKKFKLTYKTDQQIKGFQIEKLM